MFELQDGTQVPLETVADIFEALHFDDVPDGDYISLVIPCFNRFIA